MMNEWLYPTNQHGYPKNYRDAVALGYPFLKFPWKSLWLENCRLSFWVSVKFARVNAKTHFFKLPGSNSEFNFPAAFLLVIASANDNVEWRQLIINTQGGSKFV